MRASAGSAPMRRKKPAVAAFQHPSLTVHSLQCAMESSQWRERSWRRMGALAALTILLLAPEAVAKSKKVSDYFTVCHRMDPDFPGCVKRTIEEAKPRLIKGIPELRLPSIDPLRIEQLEFQEGQGNFRFVMRLKNISITGLKDFSIRSIKADVLRGWWFMDMFTPHQHFQGQYEMEGRLLALPIQGHGDASMDFYGVSTIGEIQTKNVTRKGKIYTQVESIKWTITVENAKSHFTNLFNGDKTLGETTNKFLNENWRDAFDTYKHLAEEAFSQFFTELENRFFEQFTFEELYPVKMTSQTLK